MMWLIFMVVYVGHCTTTKFRAWTTELLNPFGIFKHCKFNKLGASKAFFEADKKKMMMVYIFQCIFPCGRHLARNPFMCDCRLKWLAEYLHHNPIETSGARCESPKRMQRKRLASFKEDKLKCKRDKSIVTIRHPLIFHLIMCLGRHPAFNGCINKWLNLIINAISGDDGENKMVFDECSDTKCPVECVCEGSTVDCSNRGLQEVPKDIPEQVTIL